MSKSWFSGTGFAMEQTGQAVANESARQQDEELAKLAEPAPTPEDPTARAAMDDAAAQQRRARSRSATILSGANAPQGIGPGVGTISRRMLLGS